MADESNREGRRDESDDSPLGRDIYSLMPQEPLALMLQHIKNPPKPCRSLVRVIRLITDGGTI